MSSPDNDQPLLRHQRCRTCLSKLGEHNIFASTVIRMQLTYLMGIEIEYCDNLPSGICDDCLTNLKQAYTFKKKCEMTCTILIQERELDKQLGCLQIPIQQQYEKEVQEMDPDLENENDAWAQFQQNSLFLNLGANASSPLHASDNENTNTSGISYSESMQRRSVSRNKNNDNSKYPITCEECGRNFDKEYLLKEHISSHFTKNPYLCSECQLTFMELFDLKKHIAMRHSDDTDLIYVSDSDDSVVGRVQNINEESSEHDEVHLNENTILSLKKRLKVPETKSAISSINIEPKILTSGPNNDDRNYT